jgi:hypothetical protein
MVVFVAIVPIFISLTMVTIFIFVTTITDICSNVSRVTAYLLKT